MPREMKDSGIEWIGEIPRHWEIINFGMICDVFGRIGFRGYTTEDLVDIGEGPITLSPSNIINQKLDLSKCSYISWEKYEESPEIKVLTNDIILVKTASVGKCAIFNSKELATLNPQLVVLKNIRFDYRFLYYVIVSDIVQTPIFLDNFGSVIPTITQQNLNHYKIVFPPLSEQQAIADFLDKQCAEIDSVIEQTKATIEEYKKLKQSIITEAVTKGIRGDRPMKDSGIEWIGDIPADWEIRKLFRAIDKIGDIDHYMPESTDTGIPYLMTGDLKEKLSQVDFDVCKQVSFEDYEILSSKIKATQGDVIFARYATIGTVCIVDIDKKFLVSYSCLTIKPTKSLLMGNFLFYYLKSSAFFEDVKQYINSNTQANVGLDSMTKAKIVLPVLQEQREIVNYLDQKCAEIDTLIAKKTALLEEMESYKKSVIYEYVTGKKEVE